MGISCGEHICEIYLKQFLCKKKSEKCKKKQRKHDDEQSKTEWA